MPPQPPLSTLKTYWIYVLMVFVALFVVFLTLYLMERNKNNTVSTSKTTGETRAKNDELDGVEILPCADATQASVVVPRKSTGYVTVDMRGGLGNQLFQIATAYAYGRDNNKAFVMDHTVKELRNRHTYFDSVYKWIPHSKEMRRKNWHTMNEKNFHYDKLPNHFGNVSLDGYFQSLKYFRAYIHDLIRLFSANIPKIPAETSVLQDIETSEIPTVSMHVRRSDYVGNKVHTVQKIDYYQKALEEIRKKTETQDFRIVVFSDDIPWCKDNLPKSFSNLSYCEEPGLIDAQELQLMALCTHHIIANSSFSWWGAVLDEKPDRVVVAPSRWFNNDWNWQDVYCEGWIVV